jgi:SAM-dependent methyltransferase
MTKRKDGQLSLKEVFTKIYAENLWQEADASHNGRDFYSGPGSADELARPYADCVNRFIEENNIRSVVDIGCGDFRVGQMIAKPSISYTGIDIVEPVIQDNLARFGTEHVTFRCLDVTIEDLPSGDLCLVREVLQHLSNTEITAILAKLRKYNWAIVTECQPGPIGTFKPNRDKSHGRTSRAAFNSGVVLDAPPFNIPHVKLMLEVPIPACLQDEFGKQARIRSFVIQNN